MVVHFSVGEVICLVISVNSFFRLNTENSPGPDTARIDRVLALHRLSGRCRTTVFLRGEGYYFLTTETLTC